MKAYLLDSSFLYALINSSERKHRDVLAVVRQLKGRVYMPTVAIAEVAYLVRRGQGGVAVADFLDALVAGNFHLVEPEDGDLTRAAAIIRQYADAELDVVDAIIMAIAERLKITTILTLDQRDFRLVRPKHCVAFEIRP